MLARHSVHRLPGMPSLAPELIDRGHDARPHGAPLDVSHGAKLMDTIAGTLDREGPVLVE